MTKIASTLLCLLLLGYTAQAQYNTSTKESNAKKTIAKLNKKLPQKQENKRIDSVVHIGGLDVACYVTITQNLSETQRERAIESAENGEASELLDNDQLHKLLKDGSSIYYYLHDNKQDLITTQVYTITDLGYRLKDIDTSVVSLEDKKEYVIEIVSQLKKILPMEKNGISFDSVGHDSDLEISCHVSITMDITNEQKEQIKQRMIESGATKIMQDKRFALLMDMDCTINYYMYDNKQDRFVEISVTPEDYK